MNNLNISDWLYASFTAIVNRKSMIFPCLVYYFVTCLEQAQNIMNYFLNNYQTETELIFTMLLQKHSFGAIIYHHSIKLTWNTLEEVESFFYLVICFH